VGGAHSSGYIEYSCHLLLLHINYWKNCHRMLMAKDKTLSTLVLR